MPICQNCNAAFPNKINIGKEVRHLTGRKFCPECSPLDGRNTRSYIVKLQYDEAFCSRCQQIKNIKEFYIRKESGKPFSYCMTCQENVKRLKLEEKIDRIIEEHGGACQDCQLTYPIPVYEFYSDAGIYPISKAKNMSLERLQNVLNNYIMLCRNCSAIRKWERG